MRVKDYETSAARTQATEQLMNSEGYQHYITIRKELAEKMIDDKSIDRTSHITSVLESALGKFNPEEN
jgi:hypothetical protein